MRIRLSAANAAFLDYMMQPILPAHLLAGQDLTTTGFFRSPVGTGPFRMESWAAGKEIVLVKNEDYYRGAPKIDRFVVKIVADDAAEAKALADGTADLARLSPRAAAPFEGKDGYRFYAMKTAICCLPSPTPLIVRQSSMRRCSGMGFPPTALCSAVRSTIRT